MIARRLSAWAKGKQKGFLITALVFVSVVGLWLYHDSRKADLRKMADELESATFFWGLPKPNQANTEFLFCRRSYNGLAVFRHNAAGADDLIFEKNENSFNLNFFRVLDWSPDDKFYAFACDGHAYLRDSDTDQPAADINVGGGLANFVWLSPSSIAAFNRFDLYLITREQKHWNKTLLLTVTNATSVNTLTRLSGQLVAWRQDNDLWICDITDQVPKKITDSSTGPVEGFSLSNGAGSLLVNCSVSSGDNNTSDRHGGNLFLFSPPAIGKPAIQLGKIGKPEDYVYKAYAINQGKGCAYMTSHLLDRDIRPAVANKNVTLYIKKTAQAEPVRILGARETVDFTVNGDHLYALGSLTNEPCSIWDYDLRSGSLRCAYPGLPATKYVTFATPEYLTTTNALGESVHYYLWSPAHWVAGKNYPLMIGQTTYRWMVEAQLAANSEFYFALAERPIWTSEKINSWGEDVKSIRADLALSRDIDTNRVFLNSVSVEGAHVSRLMEETPELWKGAFLQGWHGPETMNGRSADIVMIIGDHDEENRLDDIKAYQEKAARNGINVKIVLRPGRHTTVGKDPQNQTGRQLADFYLNNK